MEPGLIIFVMYDPFAGACSPGAFYAFEVLPIDDRVGEEERFSTCFCVPQLLAKLCS